MRSTMAAMVAVMIAAAPAAAQQHGHQAQSDSSGMHMMWQQGCPVSAAGMHGGNGTMGNSGAMGRQGMSGAMGMHGGSGMMAMGGNHMMTHGDSLIGAMGFAPGHVLMFQDSLALTSDQVQKIQALHGRMPFDTTNLMPMYQNAERVRELLTPEQRQRVASLSARCGWPGYGMPHGADSTGMGHGGRSH
jgi:hypothetical protein